MNKKQYRIFVRAKKKDEQLPKKLIHLLINYRSSGHYRYPQGFIETMRWIKGGRIEWDYDALYEFTRIVSRHNYIRPYYSKHFWRRPNIAMETETDLPF